jgi:hypothetical protein
MQSDPLFVTNATLPEVFPQHMAVAHVLCGNEDYGPCNAPVRLQLDDGSNVMFQPAAGACGQYDRGDLDLMPSSDVGWSRAADGPGDVVVDNRPAIASALATHNATVNATIDTGCGCSVRKRPPALAVLVLADVISIPPGLGRGAVRPDLPARGRRLGSERLRAFSAKIEGWARKIRQHRTSVSVLACRVRPRPSCGRPRRAVMRRSPSRSVFEPPCGS